MVGYIVTMDPLPINNRFLQNASQISLCLDHVDLMEDALRNQEVCLGPDGQLCTITGEHTGRSANDKYIVSNDDSLGFGESGKPFTQEQYDRVEDYVAGYVTGRPLYVSDFEAGPVKGRIITESARLALFAITLFKHCREPHDVADVTIIALPGCHLEPKRFETNSKTFIIGDLKRGIFLIGGTAYAGEVKKSVFTYLSHILPEQQTLTMHASVTTEDDGTNSAVFFGLSGTGKTTLSADPKRKLVGDDEHGWGPDGVFNFESGCYAKVINLSEKHEPMIWSASHRFGTLFENVDMTEERVIDFASSKYTENTRAAYSLDKISNAHDVGFLAPHPKNIIMLTCDAYGVLPSVAKLSPEAAAYHFLSGYTAKVAGTEKGVTEPKATFSALFGAPFMPRKVGTYAQQLIDRIKEHKPNVWLVNTGWVDGPYGVGKRMDLPTTRKIVDMIISGELQGSQLEHNETFNLDVPVNAPYTKPRDTWDDKEAYDKAARNLIAKFHENAVGLGELDPEIIKAGMP